MILHLSLYSHPIPHTVRIKIEKARGRGGAIHITNPIRRGEIEAEGWQKRKRWGENERQRERENERGSWGLF